MTDDEVRQACEVWWTETVRGYTFLDAGPRLELRTKLMAFAKRMQAVGVKAAAQETSARNRAWQANYPLLQNPLRDLVRWCEAEAARLEGE